mgnify:CR=1 FL=1
MKHLDEMQPGGYPFDDISIAYLQQMHNDRDSFIHSVFGDNKIVKGVVLNAQSNLYSDGLITVGGKLYHFVGGTPNATISKKIIETKRFYEDGLEKKAFINEFYEFGASGTDAIDFSELKRIKNLSELEFDENLINKQPNWNENDSTKIDFIRNKPILVSTKIFGKVKYNGGVPASSLSVSGNLSSAQILNTDGYDQRIKVNFSSVGTTNYVPVIALESQGSNYNTDNDVLLSIKNITASSFEILSREISGNSQNVSVMVQIIV